MEQKKYIAYYRVSTDKQGESGLGLEAQQRDVKRFVKSRAGEIVREFTDIESGKKTDRAGLAEAIAMSKSSGATLVIAKLDRLARNAGFILQLRDSKVDFVAVDMPDANTMTVGIFAIMAQKEREDISTRTTSALASLKARGVKLGKPENFSDAGRRKGAEATRARARQSHANRTASAFASILHKGGNTLSKIADELNAAGFQTPKGCRFSATQVSRLLAMAGHGQEV